MKKFTAIVHDAVMGQDAVSVEQIADALGKKPFTVYGELNPSPGPASTAKLGLEDAITIMKLLSNDALAKAVAREFGGECAPGACVVPDKDTLDAEMLDDYPAMVSFHDAMRRRARLDDVREVMEATIRDVRETYAMYERGEYDPAGAAASEAGEVVGVRQ